MPIADDIRTAAHQYVRLGWKVFRLHGKKPAREGWQQEATTDENTVDAWFSPGLGHNLGIATGHASGIFVVDIDPAHGGDDAWREIVAGRELPNTPTGITGRGGTHLYFRMPPGADIRNSQGKIAPGIDVRGTGGYVVAPPSIHPETRHPYTWEIVADPAEVPVADAPGWLLSKIIAERVDRPKEIPQQIGEGARHEHAISLAGSLYNRGLARDVIFDCLKAWSLRTCVPPLDDAELRHVADTTGGWAIPAPVTPPPAAEDTSAEAPGDPSGAQPASAAGAKRAKRDLSGPALQAVLEEELARWLDAHGYRVNAVGQYVDGDGAIQTINSAVIGTLFTNHFRRSRQDIGADRVRDTLAEITYHQRVARRSAIVSGLLTVSGERNVHLEAWVRAVTGDIADLEFAAIAQWCWQVKRALADLPVEQHLMPVLYKGLVGIGGGKSQAIRLLLKPLAELATDDAAVLLFDEKAAPNLSIYIAALWDEMMHADRNSVEALKRIITATTRATRLHYTHDTYHAPVRTQWIASTNRPLSAMVRDPTGSRRFYEIETLARCDWDTLNAIDYRALWHAVDHLGRAPALGVLGDLRERQEEQRYRDGVTYWLEAEDWQPGLGIDGRPQPTCNPDAGASHDQLFARYRLWAVGNGAEPMTAAAFIARLREEGWVRVRAPRTAGAKRAWIYRRERPCA